jgi:hypothetical protein
MTENLLEMTELTKLSRDMFDDGMLIMTSLQVRLPVTLLDTVGISELFNPFFIELVYLLPRGLKRDGLVPL